MGATSPPPRSTIRPQMPGPRCPTCPLRGAGARARSSTASSTSSEAACQETSSTRPRTGSIPAAGTWTPLPDMPIALTGHRAVAVGPDIYVVGGFKGANGIRQGFGGVPFVWRYRPP